MQKSCLIRKIIAIFAVRKRSRTGRSVLERCSSGLRGTPGKRVNSKRVSRVRISVSPQNAARNVPYGIFSKSHLRKLSHFYILFTLFSFWRGKCLFLRACFVGRLMRHIRQVSLSLSPLYLGIDDILIFPGDGELDVVNIENIYIDSGYRRLVDKVRTVYPDKIRTKNRLPL